MRWRGAVLAFFGFIHGTALAVRQLGAGRARLSADRADLRRVSAAIPPPPNCRWPRFGERSRRNEANRHEAGLRAAA